MVYAKYKTNTICAKSVEMLIYEWLSRLLFLDERSHYIHIYIYQYTMYKYGVWYIQVTYMYMYWYYGMCVKIVGEII